MQQFDCKKFAETTKEQIQQQKVPACQPILNPLSVIVMLTTTGIIFLPIGLVLLDYSNHVKEQTFRYDNIPECTVTKTMRTPQLPKLCTISFQLSVDLPKPVYFYYGLTNFYQSERQYMTSLNFNQVMGKSKEAFTTSLSHSCTTLQHKRNSTSTPTDILLCGYLADSVMRDRFSLSVDGQTLCPNCVEPNSSETWAKRWTMWHSPDWSASDIAWKTDVERVYKDPTDFNGITNLTDTQVRYGLELPLPSVEDLMVWMRVSPLSHFRKLHRVIRNRDLRRGQTINVTIANWVSVETFSGTKSFTLATATPLGGKNYVLAYMYIVTGSGALLLAIVFSARFQCTVRTLSTSLSEFQWKHPGM